MQKQIQKTIYKNAGYCIKLNKNKNLEDSSCKKAKVATV